MSDVDHGIESLAPTTHSPRDRLAGARKGLLLLRSKRVRVSLKEKKLDGLDDSRSVRSVQTDIFEAAKA